MFRVAALVVLAACARKPVPPVIADEPAWRAKLLSDRAKADHDFKTDVTSPIAGVERFAPEETAYLALEGNALRLDATKTEHTVLTFEHRGTAWWWQTDRTDIAATPGEIVSPTLIQVTSRFAINAQTAGGALIATAFDAQRPALLAFHGVPYYEASPRFVVRAQLDRLATPKPASLATSRGLKKAFVEVGTLHFDLEGQHLTLVAYKFANSHELFIPFRDATSGKDSYGAARFLDIAEPSDPAAPVIIDFNRAYNPLCAYSPAYNCPLPPAANTLAVAITAGDRDPHMH